MSVAALEDEYHRIMQQNEREQLAAKLKKKFEPEAEPSSPERPLMYGVQVKDKVYRRYSWTDGYNLENYRMLDVQKKNFVEPLRAAQAYDVLKVHGATLKCLVRATVKCAPVRRAWIPHVKQIFMKGSVRSVPTVHPPNRPTSPMHASSSCRRCGTAV